MASLDIRNVRIAVISACVPSNTLENNGSKTFKNDDAARNFINATGVERRRGAEDGICSSDLCFESADKLISDLGWERSDIDCLISSAKPLITHCLQPLPCYRIGLAYHVDASPSIYRWVVRDGFMP